MKRIKSKSKDMKNLIDHGQEIMDRKSWTRNHEHEIMDRKSWTEKLKQRKRDLATPFPLTFTDQCDWDALLSYKLETTTTTSLVNKCNGYRWSCSVCFVAAPSFEDFTTHLKSVEHEFREWDRYASKHALDRTNRNNLPFGRSKELDLLLTQDMLRCQEMVSRKCPGGFRPYKFRSNSQSKAS
ncbi:BnaC01g35140D [Brassica napus]|uniref:BnaC01g35140D protein n=1 Tax=Brassica napus TaxID=3708 RepID=A0A078GT16_BRANA|nr:BnaC01g35140D [Brassica napus]